MTIENLNIHGTHIAVVSSDKAVINDAASALDLMMSVKYETGADRIVLSKQDVSDDFFVLSTGLAGEILQKFINYHMKLAIYGDFSQYTSKPLRDFIHESNCGKDIFFVDTREEAIRRLSGQ